MPRRARIGARPHESACVSPSRSAASASSAAPACETSPSGATSTVKRRPSRVTFEVILPSRSCRLQHPAESLLRRTVKRPRPSGPQLLHAPSGLMGRESVSARTISFAELADDEVRDGGHDLRHAGPIEQTDSGTTRTYDYNSAFARLGRTKCFPGITGRCRSSSNHAACARVAATTRCPACGSRPHGRSPRSNGRPGHRATGRWARASPDPRAV